MAKNGFRFTQTDLKRELLSLRSNVPRYARVGSLWDAGTVVATLQRPSLRSGRVLLRRRNCFRYAQTALASLGTFFDVSPRITVLAPLERPSLRSGTSGTWELLSLRSNVPLFARGGSISGTRELFSLRSNSPRSAREVFRLFAPGHCCRFAPTALATLGDPPGLPGIYLDLLGHLRTISVKPRSKFQKSEKIAFRPKNAFRPKSPLYAVENAKRCPGFKVFGGAERVGGVGSDLQ